MSSILEDSNHVAGSIEGKCEKKIHKELKICVEFDKHDKWKGEYGFDNGEGFIDDQGEASTYPLDTSYHKNWAMEFTTSTKEPRLSDFNKSKFPPVKITGLTEDVKYKVPWFCEFPRQFIQLKMSLAFLEGELTGDDLIELPAINTKDKRNVGFSPNIIKISDLADVPPIGSKVPQDEEGDMNYVTFDITLTAYIGVLNKHTLIKALDKNGNPIGYLKFLKNADYEDLHFQITPVRVVRSILKESDAEVIREKLVSGFGNLDDTYIEVLQKLENYLNKKALNQALLQCTITKEECDLVIDEAEMIAKSLINEADENCSLHKKTPLLFEELSLQLKRQYPRLAKKRGLIIFLLPIAKEDVGGQGDLYDVDAKELAIYQTNLSSKSTFVHEIGHVLGLTHTFIDADIYSASEINSINIYIKKADKKCGKLLNSAYYNQLDKKYSWETLRKKLINENFSTKNFTPEERLFIELKVEQEEELKIEWRNYPRYRFYRGYLNSYYRNPHKFSESTSENFMDYSNDRTSFLKFQWLAVQDDVKKFYNS